VFRRSFLTFSRSLGKRAEGLVAQFRSSLDRLVGRVPLTAASVSVRPQEEKPLEALYTCGFDREVADAELAIGDEGLHWLEAHHRELVLAIEPEHSKLDFYRPFIEHGIRTAIILPIFRAGRLAGTVTVGSRKREAYTARHLQRLKMMCSELMPFFARPVPASRAFAEAEPGSWGPGRPHAVVEVQGQPPPPAEKPMPPAAEAAAPSEEAHVEADALGRIVAWDELAEQIFGWTRSEAIGRFLILFYRIKDEHLLEAALLDDLLRTGHFRGRAVCYDRDGLPVTCEVELSRLIPPSASAGEFRGTFRRVTPRTLLPHEEIEFGFARLYDFSNPLTNR